MFNPRTMTLLAMIIAAAASRIIPHPWNFTPIGAMCLFGGAYFERKWSAFFVPMAALLLSDLVLAYALYGGQGFSVTSMKYVWFALTVLLGMTLRDSNSVGRITTAAVAASIMFFVLSNFHVWLGSKMYPQSLAGLLTCYVAAIPFGLNMLAANLFYSGVLFGGWEMLGKRWPALGTPAMARAT